MPKLAVVTDLGPRNEGTIIPDERIPQQTLKTAIEELATRPEYRKRATRRWRCVDGRLPEGGLASPEEGMADPQIGGGMVIADLSVDLMVEELPPGVRLSDAVAAKTKALIADDNIEVVVHGDNHTQDLPADTDGSRPATNKGGCGANKRMRDVLRSNAENADVVVPLLVDLAHLAGVAQYYAAENGEIDNNLVKDRLNTLIANGKTNAEHPEFWDVTPEEVVDIIVDNGGVYEEVLEDHAEIVAMVDMLEGALDEEAFMKDHVITLSDGTETTLEAFIASIGEYKKTMFERAERLGMTPAWAADRVLGVLLQSGGVVKRLTADGFLAAVITK